MKIRLTIFLFLLITNSFYSQNSLDLIAEKDSLKNQKLELINHISFIDNKIELLNSQIEFALLKEKSPKTTLRKNSSFYKAPNQTGDIIENVKINDVIYIVEYYQYSKYYKAIYNDKIGFIREKDIRETKEIKNLNTLGTFNNKNKSSLTNNPQNQNYSNKRVSTSRTYYRGPRGGCYYINSKGNKTYVDRSLCN